MTTQTEPRGATPLVQQLARAAGLDVTGTGPDGRVTASDVRKIVVARARRRASQPTQTEQAKPTPPAEPVSTRHATPLVRRLARDAGLNLASVTGTGPGGRITANDIRQASASQQPTRRATATATAPRATTRRRPGSRWIGRDVEGL